MVSPYVLAPASPIIQLGLRRISDLQTKLVFNLEAYLQLAGDGEDRD
jgi:hypothetical protein